LQGAAIRRDALLGARSKRAASGESVLGAFKKGILFGTGQQQARRGRAFKKGIL